MYNTIKGNTNLKFIDAKSSIHYSFEEIIFDLGAVLEKKKRVVFLYLNNDIEHVGIYFSFLKSNMVLALLNESLSIELKEKLEAIYKPKLIVDGSRNMIEGYEDILINSEVFSFNCFSSSHQSNINIAPKIKVLLSTSGTTGSPKFVKLSESNLLENAKSILNYLPVSSDDVTPLNLPIFYSYGLSVLHINSIKGGEIICGVSDILQRNFWTEFNKYKFSSISGVPYVYEMLNRIGFRKKQYPSLKYCTQAGGNLSRKTKEIFLDYFDENNVEFYVMYGQTEASARISFVPPNKLRDQITSIGKPILNGELSINEETNELVYRGPNVFGGYANTITDLELWTESNILNTGDIGKEENGFFYVTGRIKRFVKLFGNRINLDELETFLKNKYQLGTFAAAGNIDKELLIAYNGVGFDEKELKKVIQFTFKIHPSVIKFLHLEDFPLTDNGKVDYHGILELYI